MEGYPFVVTTTNLRKRRTAAARTAAAKKAMNVKENRQYVTQEELDQIKQLSVKSAVFARGRFTGFYDESTMSFYIMDQYGRLTGAVAQVPPEKFESPTPAPRESTVGEYMAQKAANKAVQANEGASGNAPASPSIPTPSPAVKAADAAAEAVPTGDAGSMEDVQDVKEEEAGKRSAEVFAGKKKSNTGLVVGLSVGGVVLLGVGACVAQHFGVIQLAFLNPVLDTFFSIFG